MYKLHNLHRFLPGHLAMNAALLVRGLRPVIQLDVGEDDDKIDAFRNALRKVADAKSEVWSYANGILVWLKERPLPNDVRSALAMLQRIPLESRNQLRKISPLVATCLRLRCPSNVYTHGIEKFRVELDAVDGNNGRWSFKQQMCADPSHIPSILRELIKYEDVGNEMGFVLLQLRITKTPLRYHSAMMGPHVA